MERIKMIKKTLILSLVLWSAGLFAQQNFIYFPIKHYIVGNSAKTGPMQDASVIPLVMSELNRVYAKINVQFYLCGIDTIYQDSIYNSNAFDANFRYYLSSIGDRKLINIFYVNSIISSEGAAAGAAPIFPNYYEDFVLVTHRYKSYCGGILNLSNIGTVIHEFGHYFELEHTFRDWNHSNTSRREHPDRNGPNANCTIRGDEFCSTPADVSIIKTVGYYERYSDNNGCFQCSLKVDSFQVDNELIAIGRTPLGWWYKPDITNYMNYADNECRKKFSTEQYEKMRRNAESYDFSYKVGSPNFITLKIGNKIDTITAFCGNNPFSNFKNGDTIYFKDKITDVELCLNPDEENRIYFPDDMEGLDSVVWFVNGDSVRTGTQKDTNGYFFELPDLSNYDSTYIVITIKVPPAKLIHFKFKTNGNNELKDAITELWKGFDKYDAETNTINADLKEEDLLIPLPDIDCEVTSTPTFATETIAGKKYIRIPQTDECDFNVKVKFACQCVGTFAFNIHNSGCDSIPEEEDFCDDIILFDTGYYNQNQFGEKKYSHYIIAKATNGKKILKIKFTNLTPSDPYSQVVWKPPINPTDSFRTSLFDINCRGLQETIHKVFEICFLIEDTITGATDSCCKIHEFSYECENNVMVSVGFKNTDIVNVPPHNMASMAGAAYLLDSPSVQQPPLDLYIGLCDSEHDLISVIYNQPIDTSNLQSIIHFNTSALPCGNYNVLYQILDGITILDSRIAKFRKNIIQTASVSPNPVTNSATVSYILNCPTASIMRISLHNIMGIELQEIFNGVPPVAVSPIPFSMGNLPNGAYIIKIEIEQEVLEIPISINIIKN